MYTVVKPEIFQLIVFQQGSMLLKNITTINDFLFDKIV